MVHGFLGRHPNHSRNIRSSSMSIYIPYTYLIGWSSLNKYYYGVRFAKKCNPSDLWVKYFTSSKLVAKYRVLYGEPDVIQIRKTFSDKNSAVLWEERVLRRLKIKSNEKMLNANIAGAIVKNLDHAKGKPSKLKGRVWTEEQKIKLRKPKSVPSSLKGTKLSDDHKEKLRAAKCNYKPWNTGKTGVQKHSTETREKMRLAKLKPKSEIILSECPCCKELKVKSNRTFCSNSCKAKYNAQKLSSEGRFGFQNKSNQDAAQLARRPVRLYGGAHTADAIKQLGEPVA